MGQEFELGCPLLTVNLCSSGLMGNLQITEVALVKKEDFLTRSFGGNSLQRVKVGFSVIPKLPVTSDTDLSLDFAGSRQLSQPRGFRS